ncbi:DUF6438 domain-containing protein [Tenacibaculum sp. ZS6-P6]|uniref:DUF6438 domain-containing protein n=1 Tax=Tenacibaculum sp. ZS6-P6 TaxID=3447503 RepID=UPI003F9E93D2
MKIFFLSIFLLALSCGAPKGDSNKTEANSEKETPTNTEETTNIDLYKRQLVLVLNDPTREDKTKEFLKNSGVQWKKMVFDNGASKIAVVEIPNDKYDFWLKALGSSSEFRSVKVNAKNVVEDLIKKEENTLLSMRKTGCFGDCPSYDIIINKQGVVLYNGKQYVLQEGEKEFKLSDKELETINNKLNKKKFSSFNAVYDNPKIMDLPSTYIVHQGKQVKIRLWNDDVPEELMDLHEYIEGILLEKKFFE